MGGGTGREGGVDREDGATRWRGRWSGKCDTTLFVKLQYHSAQLFSQFQVDYQVTSVAVPSAITQAIILPCLSVGRLHVGKFLFCL